jgi:hypothetical protein
MIRRLAFLLLVLALPARALAQPAPSDITIGQFDPEQAVAPISTIEGDGWKIGEGTVLHPVLGAEAGMISNVFYTSDNPTAAAVLRLLFQMGTGSLSPQRLTPADSEGDQTAHEGMLSYRANVRLSYDAMLGGGSAADDTGGLGAGATLKAAVNPEGRWTFGFDEEYQRLIRAANFETNVDTDRDINTVSLNLLYHPPDRSLSGYAYYTNMVDVFEASEQQFADRFQNTGGLHVNWRWLPQTTVYADASIGYFTGLGSSSIKVTSYPLNVLAGIATLFTARITANASVGYANGFYQSGPSYSGPTVDASVGYRYSPKGRIVLGYDLLYSDSIQANYYSDNVLRLWWYQMVGPVVVSVQPEVHWRDYSNITLPGITPLSPTRDDMLYSVVAGVQYFFRRTIAASVDYNYSQVATDFRYMDGGVIIDPSYVRHELMAGLRIAW